MHEKQHVSLHLACKMGNQMNRKPNAILSIEVWTKRWQGKAGSPSQPEPAQHSTAQHSTARHGTARQGS